MPPRYRYPARVTLSIFRDLLLGRKRSFVKDAERLREGIQRLQISGEIPVGPTPFLFLVNHYSRPGFRAWWISIALSSAVSRDMHWPMTSAWTYPDPLRSRLITPLTEWVLARAARMYSFTLMPPMPPHPKDAAARADSVRRILRLAHRDHPAIGIAPEGMDSPDGRLMQPPAGAGRFIAHLADAGYTLVPVGAFEEGEAFVLRFGKPFSLKTEAVMKTASVSARDQETIRIVMEKIGELLPDKLTPPLSPIPSGSPLPPPQFGEEEGGRG
jgi:hypothetical protein